MNTLDTMQSYKFLFYNDKRKTLKNKVRLHKLYSYNVFSVKLYLKLYIVNRNMIELYSLILYLCGINFG